MSKRWLAVLTIVLLVFFGVLTLYFGVTSAQNKQTEAGFAGCLCEPQVDVNGNLKVDLQNNLLGRYEGVACPQYLLDTDCTIER